MNDHMKEKHLAAGRLAGCDRTCTGKVRYGHEESATKAATAMNKKPTTRKELEPYPCPFCDGWHIGRKMSEEELDAAIERFGKET